MTIEVDLQMALGGFRLDTRFSAPLTGVTAIYGPSGSGKTTLLRALAGLEPAASGHVRVGNDTWQENARFVPPHRRGAGYVFQEPSLFPHLSVRQNLRYGMRRCAMSGRRPGFDEITRLLGLSDMLGRRPAGLSGGERQRVAIARALLAGPRVLLMDEPLAALDAASKAEIMPFLERLHRRLRVPVLYVSHSPEEVARLADHMVLLDAGRAIGAGPLNEILTRVDLPPARASAAQAVIEGRVAEYDERYHLTAVDFSGGRFVVAGKAHAVGRHVRLRVLARDVSLTLERQLHTSVQNIFAARVEAVAEDGEAQATLRLAVGNDILLSRITRKSLETLGIVPGRQVYAQVKAVALQS